MDPGASTCIARTQRLILRQVEISDDEFLITLLNDPAWLRNIGDRGVRNPTAARQYIKDKIVGSYETFGFGMYLIQLVADGSPVGLCGLVKRSSLPDPDIGFALLPGYRNNGYAQEAAQAVIGHARRIGLIRLLGIVIPENTASVRLLERLGFCCEGTYRPPHEETELRLYAQSLV